MAVVAYLRVSTEKQFLENQREGNYTLRGKEWVEHRQMVHKGDGQRKSAVAKERKLAGLLDRMKPGDSLIITEISRLSRTLLEIMTILNSHQKGSGAVQYQRGVCVPE